MHLVDESGKAKSIRIHETDDDITAFNAFFSLDLLTASQVDLVGLVAAEEGKVPDDYHARTRLSRVHLSEFNAGDHVLGDDFRDGEVFDGALVVN